MKHNACLAALAALLSSVAASKDERTFSVLRFTNKALTKGRMDPIVYPNEPSAHVHNVMGGSNFKLGVTGEELLQSNCSNALVKGDNSAYWFPSLYYHDTTNNTFESVDIFYVNAYYFFEPTNDDIKAFPVGLSIVSGDATTRTKPAAGPTTNLDPSNGPIQPVKWTCPRSNYDPPSYPSDSDGSMAGMVDPNNDGEGIGFPDEDCDGYASPLRADIHFPSCYNPAAGLTNFQENMVFPSDDGHGHQDCPDGYTHTPHLFIEVYWNTPVFADRWTQGQGTQPFVLADGDATGYSSHADFLAGWDEDLLQHIIDTCDTGTGGMDTCAGLTYGLNSGDCTIPNLVPEPVDGVLDRLPGQNPLTGWQYGGSGSDDGGDPPPPAGGSGSAAIHVANAIATPSASENHTSPSHTSKGIAHSHSDQSRTMSTVRHHRTESKTHHSTPTGTPTPTPSPSGSSQTRRDRNQLRRYRSYLQ